MVMLVSFPPILTSAPSHMGECNFYHICSKNSPQKSYTDQKERKQTTREELSLKLFSIRLRFSVKQKIIANITLKKSSDLSFVFEILEHFYCRHLEKCVAC